MKKAIHVKIPEPCHQDWSKMTPTEKGRHCASCEKEVTDFTQKSDEQVFKLLQQSPNSCGRFKKSQLHRAIKLERKSTASLAPYAASVMLPLTLLGSLHSKASSEKVLTEKVFKSIGIGRYSKPINQEKLAPKKTIIISGTITDEAGLPLPGVNVIIKGTTIGTQSDFDGLYQISVEEGQTLVFSYVGFETTHKPITASLKVLNISLKVSDEFLVEIVMTGGYIASEPEEITAKRPFGNVSFAYDWKTEEARRKQKEAYEVTKKFHKKKLKERKEARQLKRKKRKQNRRNNSN